MITSATETSATETSAKETSAKETSAKETKCMCGTYFGQSIQERIHNKLNEIFGEDEPYIEPTPDEETTEVDQVKYQFTEEKRQEQRSSGLCSTPVETEHTHRDRNKELRGTPPYSRLTNEQFEQLCSARNDVPLVPLELTSEQFEKSMRFMRNYNMLRFHFNMPMVSYGYDISNAGEEGHSV